MRLSRQPWRSVDWCVVDLETTGLQAETDEIISFAAVPIRDGRIVSGESVYSLVRPVRAPSAASVCIHGLRSVDLSDAPSLDEVIALLSASMDGAVFVAHHAAMERAFLTPALARHGRRFPRRAADTEVLGRLWYAETGRQPPQRMSLTTLARELSLPVHRPHDALGDALTTAQAFIALATHLERRTELSVGALCAARLPGRPAQLARRLLSQA